MISPSSGKAQEKNQNLRQFWFPDSSSRAAQSEAANFLLSAGAEVIIPDKQLIHLFLAVPRW